MLTSEQRGSFLAISSGFLYGFVGYFGMSVIHASISVPNMLFWRFFIASIVMIGLTFGLSKRVKGMHQEAWAAFINGAIFYGLSTLLYFFASLYIGSGLAMVIFFTYPVMVMIINYFLYGHHVARIDFISIVMIIGGMIFFVDSNQIQFDMTGIALSIISALLYAAYIVSCKKISHLSPKVSTLMVCLGCMSSNLAASVLTHSLTIPHGWSVWFNLFGISIVATIAPILLLLHSLNDIKVEKTAILSVLEPVFVLFFGVILLHEPMKLQYLVGVVIVLSGASLTMFHQSPNQGMRVKSKVKVGR